MESKLHLQKLFEVDFIWIHSVLNNKHSLLKDPGQHSQKGKCWFSCISCTNKHVCRLFVYQNKVNGQDMELHCFDTWPDNLAGICLRKVQNLLQKQLLVLITQVLEIVKHSASPCCKSGGNPWQLIFFEILVVNF